MRRIRTGLIGVSGFAASHLASIDACAKRGIAELCAVVIKPDSDYAAHADSFRNRGVDVYREYFEMYEAGKDRLDLVAIPTGIAFHAEHSIAALRNGYHVICEKPAAGTVAEAMEMKNAARTAGKLLVIGYQNLFSPSVQAIKAVTTSSRLGRLIEAKTYALWPRPASYYARNGWAGRLTHMGRKIFDSPMQNAVSHYLMNMLYAGSAMPGKSMAPQTVYMENYSAKDIESADTQFLSVETNEGPRVMFLASHACDSHDGPVTEFRYERGRVTWHPPGTTRIYEGTDLAPANTIDNGDVHIQESVFVNTINAIDSGSDPIATIDVAMQQTICIELGFESSGGVTTIAPQYLQTLPMPPADPAAPVTGDTADHNTVITGINAVIKNLFLEGTGFHEAGLPWARESTPLRQPALSLRSAPESGNRCA